MPRRLSLAILLGLITTAVLSFGITAGAAPGGGAQGDDEIGAAQQRLGEIRMEAGSAYEAHDNAVFQLAELDDEIAATDEELAAAREELEAAENELEERAAQMYKSGNVGFVDVLVGAEDFSEFANRLELWMDLIVQERDEFERVREARDVLAQKKADLEAQRDKRAAALADADAQMDRASGLEADAQAYLDSLNAEVREAMEAEQARQAQLAKEEGEKLRAQIAEEEPLAVRRAPIGSGPEEESAPALAPARGSVDQALADRRAEREAAEAYAAEKAAEAEQARLAAEGDQAAEDAEALQAAAEAADRRAALAEERAAGRAAAEEAAAQEAEELAAAQEQYAADQAALDAAEQQYADGQYADGQYADGQEDTGGETTSGGGGQYAGGNQYGSGPTTGAAGAQPSAGAGGGSASGSAVVAEAAKYMGTPYVLGGPEVCKPYEMMDCSCFTMTVYQAFGISLPDSPGAQMGYGTPVSGPPQAGDLLFWNEDGSGITHVGIAMGDGTTIHASAFAGYAVSGTPIDAIPGYVGARRLL